MERAPGEEQLVGVVHGARRDSKAFVHKESGSAGGAWRSEEGCPPPMACMKDRQARQAGSWTFSSARSIRRGLLREETAGEARPETKGSSKVGSRQAEMGTGLAAQGRGSSRLQG